MRKSLLLTLFMLLSFGIARAETVQVGEFEYYSTSSYPTNPYFNYSLSQQVYFPSELGGSKTITTLAFFNTGPEKVRDIDIYMMHTSLTKLETYTNVTSSGKVFSGTVTFVQNDWTTITLTTPFAYNGSDNLLITIDDNTGTWSPNNAIFRTYNSTDGAVLFNARDSEDYDPANTSEYSPNSTYAKNQIQVNGVTIGDATRFTGNLPTSSLYNYSVTQQIYTATEIGRAGTIKSVSFMNIGYEKTRNLDIYVKHTDKSAFEVTNTENGKSTDWISVATTDKVFSGTVTFTVGNWTTITFDTPFEYNGTDNLAFVVDDNTGTWQSGLRFAIFTATNQSLSVRQDANDFDVMDMTGSEVSLEGAKNIIQFDFDDGGSSGEDVIEIGSNKLTSTDKNLPTCCSYNYSLSQQIFNADEIGKGGTIRSISFYNTSSESRTRTVDLYLKHTDIADYGSDPNWIPVTSSDMVFSGTVTFAPTGWTTITFSKPFVYNGTDNLAVTLDDNTGTSESDILFSIYYHDNSVMTSKYYRSNSDIDVSTVNTFTARCYFNNVIRLDMSEGGGGSGDDDLVIGSGETTNTYLPTYSFYNYSLTQQIYTASELGAAKDLTSISFYNAGNEKKRNLDIYLVPTSKTSFTITDTENSKSNDWIPFTEADKVFSGEVVFTGDAWTAIPFLKTFSYDGTSNLAIIVDDNTGTWESNGLSCRVFEATSQAIRIYSDATDYNAEELSSYAGTIMGVKNQIKFTFPGGGGSSGDDDVIGSGDATNGYLPTYSYYNYSLTQQIYTASELGAAKDLTSISFYNAGAEKTRNLDIYLVPTSKTNFTITDTENSKGNDWVNFTDADKVFSGEVTFTANEWTALPFFKTFSYDGTSNLALIVDDNTGTYSQGLACRVFNTTTTQAIYIYSDGTNYNAAGLSSYSGIIQSVKNQIKLNEVGIVVALGGITVTDIEWNSATVTWYGGGSRWVLQYKPQEESEWNTVSTMSQSYTLTDLSGETTYDVRVQIDFGDDTYSEYVTTSFTTPEQYPKPTDVELLAVTPYTAAFNWTENGTATKWQIVIYDGDEFTYDVDSKPYIVTGLKQNTTYYMWVRAIIDADNGIYSNWSEDYCYFTTPEVNPVPTDIAVSTTPTSATISWEGKSDSYVVKYRKLTPKAGTFDFDDGTLQGWTTIDADGDGNTWVSSAEPGIYHTAGADLTGSGYGGSAHFVLSGSYANQTSQALTPNNYLVSPSMELGGKISFYACAQDASYPAEHFGVAVSTTGNTDASAFTTIAEWTLTAAGTPSSRRKDQGTWGLFEVDLSDYEGQTGYVAIRHFGCTDQFVLNIDDINFSRYDEVVEEEPWQTIETTDKTVTIDGLESETTYQYEVIGIVKGNEDASSSIRRFTTLEYNPMPTDVAVTATNTSATISWTGYSDGYVVRYRETASEAATFFDDFENGLNDKGWTAFALAEYDPSNPDGWRAMDAANISSYYENHSGSAVACAQSCWEDSEATMHDITANNWLITPQVDLGGTLKFWQWGDIEGVYLDSYEVLLSTTGTETTDFTVTLRDLAPSLPDWNEVTIDLSAYEGQKGYIAIHHSCAEQLQLFIDDFGIYQMMATGSAEWQTTGGFETTITIDGLKPNTEYEFYIQGAMRTGEVSPATEIFTFMTADPIDLALDNDADNGSILSDNNGAYVNVTVNNLTLKKDGKWQTICLPFDVNVENSILAGADVRTLESVTKSNDVLILNCLTSVTEMKAGVPYIIKWDDGEDIVNPVFNEVNIQAALDEFTVDGVEFHESLYKVITAPQDYIACFLVAGDPILSYITTGYTLHAFEPYFWIGDLCYSYHTIVLNTGDVDDLLDGISSVKGIAEDEVIYNIAGQRLAKKQRGINIINGKKVLVK